MVRKACTCNSEGDITNALINSAKKPAGKRKYYQAVDIKIGIFGFWTVRILGSNPFLKKGYPTIFVILFSLSTKYQNNASRSMLFQPMGKLDTFLGPPDFKDTDHMSATIMCLTFAEEFRNILRMHLRSNFPIITELLAFEQASLLFMFFAVILIQINFVLVSNETAGIAQSAQQRPGFDSWQRQKILSLQRPDLI